MCTHVYHSKDLQLVIALVTDMINRTGCVDSITLSKPCISSWLLPLHFPQVSFHYTIYTRCHQGLRTWEVVWCPQHHENLSIPLLKTPHMESESEVSLKEDTGCNWSTWVIHLFIWWVSIHLMNISLPFGVGENCYCMQLSKILFLSPKMQLGWVSKSNNWH